MFIQISKYLSKNKDWIIKNIHYFASKITKSFNVIKHWTTSKESNLNLTTSTIN